MIGTYAAVVAVCGASLAIGQAALGLCGQRRWSWLSPAVGLALVCAVCWATVRLPGDGVVSALAVLALVVASAVYLWGRLEGGGEALRAGWPVALVALLAASLPFAVEGHFGILGTSFNPDMSQHLLATARLADGHSSQLLNQGYPLGPHSVVVALNKGLGVGLVQGFSGLSVAVMVLAPLMALAAFRDLGALPRAAGALVVGLAYVVASYFAQGAFKETIEALLVLAFVLALREANQPEWRDLPLRFVPAGLIAVGAVYVYSFPGLIWMVAAFVIWALAGFALERRWPAPRAVGLGLLVFAVFVAPEIGRMIDFHKFETFDPNGPGLGNLFGQVSPFEALGIWPSGDFRLAAGDGAVPTVGYYLGIAFALVLLGYGVARCWRRREIAVLSGLAAAALAYLAARSGGTAYTAAKAIEIAAPLVALTIILPLTANPWFETRRSGGKGTAGSAPPESRFETDAGRPNGTTRLGGGGLQAAALAVFVLAAGVCSALAFANAPVGPTSYSPALTGLRPLVANGSTLVLASTQLLADEHGTPYISWELRGGRVCIAAEDELDDLTDGVRFVVTRGTPADAPFRGLKVRKVAPPYVLWEATGPVAAKSPCPLIAVRQARQGPTP
ncbi:MAG TPA: hypothetical protein VLL27_15030 [Solirubrobacterales bacterium]|nr:hypothetical protein [Solirubrobacterales bacterium]